MLHSNMRVLRERKRLTQGEISKRLGMARTTYSGYENGAREPDPDTLKKLADFHEVSVDYLLGRNTTDNQARYDAFKVLYDRLPQSKKSLVDEIVKDMLGERK